MSVSEMMLQLVEEMVNVDEAALENDVEDAIECEDDIVCGTAEDDDDIISFIDDGSMMGYEDPVDLSDMSVEDAINDDLLD